MFHGGVDLYGIDLCVDLLHRCTEKFPNIGLLFALGDPCAHGDYLGMMQRKLNSLGIDRNFHFMTGQKELWPLFKVADLSVRPTVSDGDAISVRESLYFGCPVIASDAAQRPGETIVFKSRDIDDLYEKVVSILESKERENIVSG